MFTNLSRDIKIQVGQVIVSSILLILAKFAPMASLVSFFVYLVAYLIVARKVLSESFHNIKAGNVFDENFLMSIATIGAFILGEYAEGVFVMLFYTVGEIFESIAVGRSRDSIKSLLEYSPDQARVLLGDKEEILDPEDVEIGQTIVVYAGEKIPLDGYIIEGISSLNMAFLTGEALPVDVEVNDQVYSGSINNSGVLYIKTTSDFEDSTVSKILEMIEESAAKKSVLENFISRFARVYTPFVAYSALALAFIPGLIVGGGFQMWIERALIFLVVSCPCALVVSVPLSFFGGVGRASKNGILVKGSNYLEALAMVDTIAFDKTGTLTKGIFKITEVQSQEEDEEWLKITGSIESFSNHPIAQSITKEYGDPYARDFSDLEEIHGMGLKALYKGQEVLVGNKRLMEDHQIDYIENKGLGTVSYVAIGGKFMGSLLISDEIKEDTLSSLERLKRDGIKRLALITGDKRENADQVAGQLGLDEVYAELLPGDKLSVLEGIMKEEADKRFTAYVGDGINDAPVLRRADVGVAMGGLGSDVAIESADIVLMDDNLSKLPLAIEIAKKTSRIAKENIVFAIGIKFLVLGLSALGMATMLMAIFADVGVMVLAVLNATRTMK